LTDDSNGWYGFFQIEDLFTEESQCMTLRQVLLAGALAQTEWPEAPIEAELLADVNEILKGE